MATLATTVDGLKLPNPFIIGSGPPGTNLNVITRAFREGWGAVIAKTVSLEASKVVNVTPRYAKLHSNDRDEVIGWENIELISDRKFDIWLDEFKKCKDQFPDGILIASIMEEYNRDAWTEIVERCQDTGVDAFTTPGGYSCKAVRPIALRMVMEIATMIRREFPGRSLSGIGGIESGGDAAQFILLGADTTQVCTGVMKFGYECVKRMCDELLAFMEKHKFETLDDFKGKSLDYFTTHRELVRMQTERKAKDKAAAEEAAAKKMVRADGEWSGDDFVKQSDALARG